MDAPRSRRQPAGLVYQDEIRVAEYFLFDPWSEYLNPALQGHRLSSGRYEPIVAVGGRLPSAELGLHLEAAGTRLRFYDPPGQRWLPTFQEALEESEAARRQSEAEAERLRQELAALRGQG